MPAPREFRRAVRLLGGSHRTAKMSGVGRTRIDYWLNKNVPRWAKDDVERIISLAQDAKNWKEGNCHGETQGKAKDKARH
jgi:hypothetical protein